MKNKKGLTLVETLVALTIFAVMSAGVSALVVSSNGLRKGSESRADAQQLATLLIENHKEFWSVRNNYEGSDMTVVPDYLQDKNGILKDIPDDLNVTIAYSCLSSEGKSLKGDEWPLYCSTESPPLRSVRVTIKEKENQEVLTDLQVEIGLPIARDKDADE